MRILNHPITLLHQISLRSLVPVGDLRSTQSPMGDPWPRYFPPWQTTHNHSVSATSTTTTSMCSVSVFSLYGTKERRRCEQRVPQRVTDSGWSSVDYPRDSRRTPPKGKGGQWVLRLVLGPCRPFPDSRVPGYRVVPKLRKKYLVETEKEEITYEVRLTRQSKNHIDRGGRRKSTVR